MILNDGPFGFTINGKGACRRRNRSLRRRGKRSASATSPMAFGMVTVLIVEK